MASYLVWNEKNIEACTPEDIQKLYGEGYVLTRLSNGVMQQTRSIRVHLSAFELSSENRRILKKNAELSPSVAELPFPGYDWTMGKMAKDFYDTKFGPGIFSANKARELLSTKNTRFNLLLIYRNLKKAIGYAICYDAKDMLHYSYPFYDVSLPKDTGLGMMLQAILWAKDARKQYIYLGSLQRPSDIYKLQFSGLEWFDGKTWQTDLDTAKKLLK